MPTAQFQLAFCQYKQFTNFCLTFRCLRMLTEDDTGNDDDNDI
jgi:hypothetical protein